MAFFALGGCAGQSDTTEGYPSQPIKIIVPFKSGGETDTFARIIQRGIEKNKLLPVELVVFNLDGAGATVGSRRVKDAEPDGYTILLLHNALFTAKFSKTAEYGPAAFEPVAGTGDFGMVVTVAENSPYQSLRQLLTAAKERPDTITFGINRGTPSHYAALRLERTLPGAEFRYVQTGSGTERHKNVIGGHTDVSVFAIGEYVRFDGMKALAYFGEKRHPGAPDVPTAKEQGFPMSTSNMQFWWFPKGTDKKRVKYFAEVLRKAMKTKYVKEQMKSIYCEPEYVTGKELQRRIQKHMNELKSVTVGKVTTLPDFPVILGVIVLGLAGIGLGRRWFVKNATQDRPKHSAILDLRRTWQAVFCVLLTIVYILSLQYELMSFRLATIAFILVIGSLLTGFRRKPFIVFVIVALVLGFGLQYVFTEIFVVDLVK